MDNGVYFDRTTNQFAGLDEAIKLQLKEAYKGNDVDAELARMKLWLTSPKGKARKGNMSFILNWLNNASASPVFAEPIDLDTHPLSHLLEEYRQGLWKNCEHILEINTIKKKS